MHVITSTNYEEATDATRDILMMYWDMAYSTSGFAHLNNVYVRFDPLKFIDAVGDGTTGGFDVKLLNEGSAVAILCAFYDVWEEEQSLSNNPQTKHYEDALLAGRLRRFPDIEEVIRSAIERDVMPIDDCWFDDTVTPIYRKYVTGLFARLAASDRNKT